MLCLDSTFCIDLANGVDAARKKAEQLSKQDEQLAIAAPALTEFMVGAFAQGGKRLAQALDLVAQLKILAISESEALDAARLGGECVRRGSAVGNVDLLIAAAARQHGARVLTRDPDFGRIPDLLVETY